MNRPMYDRRSWTLKRFFGESFKFQSLADFKCPAPGCSEKTRESNESLAVKLLTQNEEIGLPVGATPRAQKSWGPP